MTEPIIHKGGVYLMVKAPVGGMCVGCVFEDAGSSECPRDEFQANLCYEAYDDEIKDDKIFIHHTDEALAAYVTKTLEGTWEIEVEQANDGEHE